ncbi:MAG TPA: alpha-glucan family phosphorylase [Gammaproteobacteria bacterium]|jgi:starch phosphorylase
MVDTADTYTRQSRVAYFSMEIALRSDIPTYAGGLGMLAGDTLRSAADLELPMVAVTLVSRAGYLQQTLADDGTQREGPDPWAPEQHASPSDAMVVVHLEGRRVWIRAWLYELKGHQNGVIPVLLLDTDIDENGSEDRQLTHYLYGGDEAYRLKQEAILGIGGVRMLYALGFRIRQYHLNEGHAALLALELAQRAAYSADDIGPDGAPFDLAGVRAECNFTTHTPVEAGHDQFSYDLVARVLGDGPKLEELKRFGGRDRLNMTRLALNLSDYVNGVAKKHAEVSRTMFPGYRVHAVTNGVHPYTWTAKSFSRLYNEHLPGWCHEPELLVRADQIADEAIWQAHVEAKQQLIDLVRQRTRVELDPDRMTIGFARRMTAYKRPDLLFSDLFALRELTKQRPLQIVLAGKAHPRDHDGKALIKRLHAHAVEFADQIPVAFIAGYDMAAAQALVAGVDLWLNTPRPPLEASGTSGMKASFNGVPSLSVLDGWWIEGCVPGVTGWPIDSVDGSDAAAAASLYRRLREDVLPLYYEDRVRWIAVMKGAISKNASQFNSHRMLRRYVSDAYFR